MSNTIECGMVDGHPVTARDLGTDPDAPEGCDIHTVAITWRGLTVYVGLQPDMISTPELLVEQCLDEVRVDADGCCQHGWAWNAALREGRVDAVQDPWRAPGECTCGFPGWASAEAVFEAERLATEQGLPLSLPTGPVTAGEN